MVETFEYQERVKLHADGERTRLALKGSYRQELKTWAEEKKVRTEAMGYLRVIFQDGNLAATMRGLQDPYDALQSMREILGIADPDQLMSTIGTSIADIPFTMVNQRDEGAVTRLLKEALDHMYLVLEIFLSKFVAVDPL